MGQRSSSSTINNTGVSETRFGRQRDRALRSSTGRGQLSWIRSNLLNESNDSLMGLSEPVLRVVVHPYDPAEDVSTADLPAVRMASPPFATGWAVFATR
jgi:hypothetical protein